MRYLMLWGLLLFACAAQAQLLNDSTLQCVSYWNLDESHVFEVQHYKEKITGNDTIRSQSISYKARLSVVDSTATSYTILWHYYDYEPEAGDSLMRMLMSIANEMDAVYTTNEMGVFQDLKNAVEMQEYMYQGLDSMAKMYASVPGMNTIIAQLKQSFSTKEAIVNGSIEEILLFHRLMGNQFETGKTYQSDVQLPNIWGGAAFDALQEADIYAVDTAEATSVIRIVTTVEKTQVKQAVLDYARKIAKAQGIEGPADADVPEMDMQIRYVANMDLPSGWPLYIVNIKDVTTDDVEQLDTIEITLLE